MSLYHCKPCNTTSNVGDACPRCKGGMDRVDELPNKKPPLRDWICRPSWMIGTAECDWKEDRDHENGQYFNKCLCCNADFIGHKRRHVCRRCYLKGKAEYDAMSPEQQADHDAKRDAAIAELFRSQG